MKLFKRNIQASFYRTQEGDDILFGIGISHGECECCGEPVLVTRIGIGFGELNIFVQHS